MTFAQCFLRATASFRALAVFGGLVAMAGCATLLSIDGDYETADGATGSTTTGSTTTGSTTTGSTTTGSTTTGSTTTGSTTTGSTTTGSTTTGPSMNGSTTAGSSTAGSSTSTSTTGAGGAGGQTTGMGGTGGTTGGGGMGGTPLRPTGITVNPSSTPTALQAPSTSGTAFNQTCATNEVVIGFMGTVDPPDASSNWLRGFQAICGTPKVTGTGPYAVQTTRAETLPAPGFGMGSTMQSRLCATDQVVVGFGGQSGGYIDQLDFICAPLAIGGGSPTFTLSVGPPRAPLGRVGGPSGRPFAAINCGANQVAVGDTGRAGQFVDAFGLLCATPSLVAQ